MTDGWCLVCVSNIPVCTMFLSFSFVAYQDVWNKRPFFVVVQKIILYSHVQRKRVCVGFVCVWMNARERERERGQLHNTSFLSPALHPQIDHIETFISVCFALIMRWPPLFSPLFSPHGEPSLDLEDTANHEGHYCVYIGLRLYVCIQRACSFTVCRKWVETTGTQFEYMCFLFFLYVCECTFVPKNLDRVRGHWDINSFSFFFSLVFLSECDVRQCSAQCVSLFRKYF